MNTNSNAPFSLPWRRLWGMGLVVLSLGFAGGTSATEPTLSAEEIALPGPSALRRAFPSAGENSRTLIISDAPALPFSLLDLRLVVAGLLSRVQTEFHLLGVEEVTGRDLDAADYLVLLGVTGDPRLFEILRQALEWRSGSEGPMPPRPLLLIGTVAVGAVTTPTDPGTPIFRSWPEVELRCGSARWTTALNAWAEGKFGARAADRILAEVRIPGQEQALPLAWQKEKGAVWHVRTLPVDFLTGRILAEVALDFFGVQDVGPSGVVAVVTEMAVGGDPGTLRRISDWCQATGVSFGVGFRLPEGRQEPTALHHFTGALRYAQARSGRLLLHTPENGWWNATADAPPPLEQTDQARQELTGQLQEALVNQLLAVGLIGPAGGNSDAALRALGQLSQTRLGPWQVSEATATVTFSAATVMASQPTGGGSGAALLLPEASWLVLNNPADPSWEMARQVLTLRGSVLAVTLPAWESFDRLKDTLESLHKLSPVFLNLLDAPVAVTTPQAVLRGSGLALSPDVFGLEAPTEITTEAFDAHGQEILKETLSTLPTVAPSEPAGAALWLWRPVKNP